MVGTNYCSLSLNVCVVKEKRIESGTEYKKHPFVTRESRGISMFGVLQGDAEQCFHHADERLLGALKPPPLIAEKELSCERIL